jgi:hypothetical protein
MNHTTRAARKRFKRFILEAPSETPSLVPFQITFDPPVQDASEAILTALEKAAWIASSLGLEDGAIFLAPIESGEVIAGWDFLVATSDPKAASLLQAHLLNGYLGEASARVLLGASARTLVETGPKGKEPSPSATRQRWFAIRELRGLVGD